MMKKFELNTAINILLVNGFPFCLSFLIVIG